MRKLSTIAVVAIAAVLVVAVPTQAKPINMHPQPSRVGNGSNPIDTRVVAAPQVVHVTSPAWDQTTAGASKPSSPLYAQTTVGVYRAHAAATPHSSHGSDVDWGLVLGIVAGAVALLLLVAVLVRSRLHLPRARQA